MVTISVSLCVPAAAGFVELIVSSPCCLSAAPDLPDGEVAGHVVGIDRIPSNQFVKRQVGLHATLSEFTLQLHEEDCHCW